MSWSHPSKKLLGVQIPYWVSRFRRFRIASDFVRYYVPFLPVAGISVGIPGDEASLNELVGACACGGGRAANRPSQT